jgi:hypothetical protein
MFLAHARSLPLSSRGHEAFSAETTNEQAPPGRSGAAEAAGNTRKTLRPLEQEGEITGYNWGSKQPNARGRGPQLVAFLPGVRRRSPL